MKAISPWRARACALNFGALTLSTLSLLLAAPPAQADDAETIVVTATRYPERALDAPAGLTVITAEQIAHSAATNLPELLATQAGIFTRDNSGSPDRSIDLRGFGITGDQNTLVLINGQRLNEIELTTVRWSSIPLDSVERIEIMRGSGAVLYGDGASGGAINIITRSAGTAGPTSGSPGSTTASIGGSAGTFNSRETRLDGAHSGEGWSVSGHANNHSSDNYRANNRDLQHNADAEVRWRQAGSEEYFNVGFDHQSLRLPGALTQAQIQADPRATFTPDDYSSRSGGRANLGTRIDLPFGQFAVDLGYRDSVRNSFFGDYSSGTFDPTSFFNTYIDTRTHVWSLTPRLQIPFEAAGMRHSLVLGIDADDWSYDSRRSTSPETLGTPAAYVIAAQQNQAFYAQDNIALTSSTKLTVGGRVQRDHMQAQDLENPAAYAMGEKTSIPRAWEVALRQQLAPAWSVYGKTGQSFRFATVDEVYSQFGGPFFDAIVTVLNPQTSHNNEAGVEYRSGKVHLRASAFDMKLDNEIYFFAPTFSNINLPPTERRGIELEAGFNPVTNVALSGNLSLTDAKFRNGVIGGINVTGNTIPLVPRQLANLSAAWTFMPGMSLSGVWRYVGEQVYDNDQTNTFPSRMPAYSTTDLKLSATRGPVTAGLAVTNLFDKHYYSYAIRNGAGTSFNAYPEATRAIVISLEYALK